jgi:Arc/MetJ family transcription regulator
MVKRTTIEIDQELLSRAKRALGRTTIKETVEEALRLAAEAGETEHARRAADQRRYLGGLKKRGDVGLLRSGEMWR